MARLVTDSSQVLTHNFNTVTRRIEELEMHRQLNEFQQQDLIRLERELKRLKVKMILKGIPCE